MMLMHVPVNYYKNYNDRSNTNNFEVETICFFKLLPINNCLELLNKNERSKFKIYPDKQDLSQN
jgi:hypothetical protein